MIDNKSLNEFIQSIMQSLPAGLQTLPQDVKDNLRASLHSAFSKLDLVTREEFDTQTQVLLRTRMKLEALEEKLRELEQRN